MSNDNNAVNSETDSDLSRRTILKQLGVAGASVTGLGGISRASAESSAARTQVDDAERETLGDLDLDEETLKELIQDEAVLQDAPGRCWYEYETQWWGAPCWPKTTAWRYKCCPNLGCYERKLIKCIPGV